MSSRRKVRERVMQALYARELGGGDAKHVIGTVLRPALDDDGSDGDFAEKLFLATLDCQTEADSVIQHHTQNWEISRIALIDRLLLRMAICEMMRFEDIPPKVSINEAIEVAKKYSTGKSSKFINGILDAALLSFHTDGKLNKTGRGLVGIESIRERAAS